MTLPICAFACSEISDIRRRVQIKNFKLLAVVAKQLFIPEFVRQGGIAFVPVTIWVLVCLTQCTHPIELPSRESDRRLIVEGFITDKKGPHTIRLTRSADYSSAFVLEGVITAETGALVFVRKGNGEVIQLTESGDGYYQTPKGFGAEQGETYSLNIETSIGESYASLPVSLPNATSIEDAHLRFFKSQSSDGFDFVSGMNIFLEFQDDPTVANFYMSYTTDGVFPWTAHPELAPPPEENTHPCPPNGEMIKCFRYERDYFQPNFREILSAGCFAPEARSFDFKLANDLYSNGKVLTTLGAFIEDDGRRFEFSYRVNVHLLTISPEAFGFYQRLASQVSIDGDIFDPPPANTLGNIINLGDASQNAIGFFGAYTDSQREMYIEGRLLDFKRAKKLFVGDCINLDSSTLIPPIEWHGSRW